MTILSSPNGRYKYTGIYADQGGPPHFGTWMAPPELDVADKFQGVTHVVASADMGFLDRIAVRYYGEGMEMLWWAVCRVNGIVDPEVDMYPGYRIYIPSKSRVMEYVKAY